MGRNTTACAQTAARRSMRSKILDGRGIGEALLDQFERDDAAMPVPTPPEVFSNLRARLGMSRR
jgi:hypothetical protein